MMSSVRNTKTKPDAEEAKISSADLVKQGYVLEVTARDPDLLDTITQDVTLGKIYDWYHHACHLKNCTHEDKSTCGDWKRIPAADASRCVN